MDVMRHSVQVRRGLLAGLLSAAFLAGCEASGDAEDTLTSNADTSGATSPDSVIAPGLPENDVVPAPAEAVRETISIEGSQEVIDARRFMTVDAFPLAFETIVPGDMEVATGTTDPAREVRIEAAFAGIRRPDAHLSIVVLPAGTDEETALARTTALADSLGGVAGERRDLPWAVRSFRLTGPRSGFLTLGKREDRWFQLLTAYPPEFGDGMGPRIGLILRRWRWADGSALLESATNQDQ